MTVTVYDVDVRPDGLEDLTIVDQMVLVVYVGSKYNASGSFGTTLELTGTRTANPTR